jgi:aldehyde:ferredoxin oxidoreductase
VEKLLAVYGEKNSVMCIGPAGEYHLASASIQSTDVDGRPCRAAGRGGMGAVMGAKGLKALVIDQRGKNADAIADPQAFMDAVKVVVEAVKVDPMSAEVMPNLGTAALVAPVNAMGAFPSYNATKGQLDGWEKISGEAMAEIIKERGGKTTHRGCDQCMIHCSNEYVDKEGKFITSSLEYETIWATGGMTGITDLDVIARLDFLCDDIGLDTMNTGVAVAVAMDAGYKEFGDAEAAVEMVEEIARGTEFGRILGNGPAAVGEHFNHHRVPVVKRQSIAAYDPRGMLGNGVTYATSPMGADHTAGNVVGAYLERKLDPLNPEGQADTSRFLQTAMAAFDCMGQCFMASVTLLHPDGFGAFQRLIEAKSGTRLEEGYFPFGMGARILKAEKEFNRRAGLTKEDDRLPRFFYEEPCPHNKVFTISDVELDNVLEFK